jgi:hypothetical protein
MYTIEKGFELVDLEGKIFYSEDGLKCAYRKGYYGFRKNGLYVARKCKSAGGSTLPMAYDIKIAKHLIEEGFIKEELSYCKEIER